MSSTPPSTSSSTASNVHQYLHLAPPYARPSSNPTTSRLDPSSSHATTNSTAKTRAGTTANDPKPWEEEQLRKLVLEYLLSGCYGDSAQAFAQEIEQRKLENQGDSGETSTPEDAVEDEGESRMEGIEATPPPEGWASRGEPDETAPENGAVRGDLSREQLEDARLRNTIRESILAGRIAQATSLINDHYPSVLARTSPGTSFPSLHTQLSKPPNPCTPKSFFVLPEPSAPTAPSSITSSIPIVGASFGSWATSLSPEILSLNLQLQSFVELMRTGHATSALSTPSTPTSSVNGLNGANTATEDTGMTSSITSLASSTTSTSLVSAAITASQALLSSIQALPPSKEKKNWERECVDVCGLLAYKDLTNCPVRGYLEMSRREGLAEMVNSAILQQTNRTPLPILALAARSATALWSTLAEMKVQFPPIPPTTTTLNLNGTTKTKVTKSFPSFDFHQFVNENIDPRASSTTTETTNPREPMQS